MQELVVLVDEYDIPIGTAPKDSVHSHHTPLHRAFSLFVFNAKHEVLLTKRAAAKKAFPGVWTNAVCGHPAPGEVTEDAVIRRLSHELGIMNQEVYGLQEVSPYRYRFADKNGIVENEICPIYIGFFDGNPIPNASEIDDWKWVEWDEFLVDEMKNSKMYSPWCIEEASILQQKGLGPR